MSRYAPRVSATAPFGVLARPLVSMARAADGAPCVRVTLPLAGVAPDDEDRARARCPGLAHLQVHEATLVAEYAIAGAVELARLSGAARVTGIAAIHLGHALASALAEAHAASDEDGVPAPIVHGRIGPEEVILDARGGVHLLGLGLGALAGGGPGGTRDDVYALATLLLGLGLPREGEIGAALRAAAEPRPERRRMTACELAEWLARGADPEAGRRALAALVARAEARDRPLSPVAQVAVAALAAALVFGLGVLVAECGCAR